jgi:hypothetical protein
MARNAGATEQLLDQRRNDGEDRVSGQLGWVAIGVVILLAAFALQLALQARRESQTWDEGRHTFAGKVLDARRFRRKP